MNDHVGSQFNDRMQAFILNVFFIFELLYKICMCIFEQFSKVVRNSSYFS